MSVAGARLSPAGRGHKSTTGRKPVRSRLVLISLARKSARVRGGLTSVPRPSQHLRADLFDGLENGFRHAQVKLFAAVIGDLALVLQGAMGATPLQGEIDGDGFAVAVRHGEEYS